MAFRKFTPKRFRKVVGKRRLTRRARVPRRSAVTSEAVRKVMFKNAETKRAYTTLAPTSFNSTVSGLSDLYSILPDIAQGTGNNARVGERITPTYLNIRGYLTANTTITAPTTVLDKLDVDLFFLMDKVQRDGQNRDANSASFIRQGSQVTLYDGTYLSSCAPVDTDRFKVLKRYRARLIPYPVSSGQLNGNPTSGANVFKFNITIPFKHILRSFDYNSNTNAGQQPMNCNMFMAAGFAQYMNPTTPTPLLDTYLRISYMSTLYYKDL